MKNNILLLIFYFICLGCSAQLNVTAKLVKTDSLRGRVDTLNIINSSPYFVTVNDTLLNQYISDKGGSLTNGQYSPTITDVTNISSSSGGNSYYYRVGNFVTVWFNVSLTVTSTTTATSFRMSLPVSTDITGSTQITGAGQAFSVATGVANSLVLSGVLATDDLLVDFISLANTTTIINGTITYIVQ